ncbi:hypothetical protein [Actinocatenispora sera]|uniref:Uncharacterized protein n=1 Tax=Actinocatenispora sera TaxID=390989 RepID=A0A810L8S3_9ACTN|nr:hypothetical protein [Actinocatenispora sera]BCJ31934.1 hypothetical protein Asera_60420 [Actinocatenispora sera]
MSVTAARCALSMQTNWPATVAILGCALLAFIALLVNPWALICWTSALRV